MEIEIPNGIDISVEGLLVKAKGPKGELQKKFSAKGVRIKHEGNKIEIECENNALKKTLESHIRNIIHGVQNGYSKKLKLLYSHFPFTLEIKNESVHIKNFLGEKMQRVSNIVKGTNVEINGQEVIVSGPDKESVGQTTANIKQILRTRKKDGRVFQDGAYEVGS